MARIVLIGTLLLGVLLALALPIRYPAERFLGHLRAEHQLSMDYWGQTVALRILDRTLAGMDGLSAAARPDGTALPDPQTSKAVADLGDRLLRSTYATSLEALMTLATYRLLALAEWLPWLVPLGLVLVVDGRTTRIVRSKEFVQHDPELYALYICVAAVLSGGLFMGALLPVTLSPLAAMAVVVICLIALSRAFASFHRAG